MGVIKNSLACLLGVFFLGCASMTTPQKSLSVGDFIRLYNNPGTPGDYWEYKGVKDGRYWLYHYGFKQPQLSVVGLIEKGFVAVNEMPANFPSTPQPKLKSADSIAIKAGLDGWLKETNAHPQGEPETH